jgi:Ni/Co efflux regulator RcnB
MKLFLTTALALSLIAGSAAVAQPRSYDRHDQASQTQRSHDQGGHDFNNRDRRYARGASDHRWSRGERLPPQYRTSDRYVDYRANHLRRPARGRHWVRMDNGRYAEIALATGLIYSIVNAR